MNRSPGKSTESVIRGDDVTDFLKPFLVDNSNTSRDGTSTFIAECLKSELSKAEGSVLPKSFNGEAVSANSR